MMPRRHRHIPPLFRTEIKRAYDRDKTTPVADIAADFGVSPSYPSKLAKREGLEMRRPRKNTIHDERNDP